MEGFLATLPPEIVALLPLALAAGIDLYLALLFLGAAPATGWWDTLPGALGDLASPGVLITVGAFYLLEVIAEVWPSSALVWNTFHAIIRPLSGALLALLLLDGQPLQVLLPAAVMSGLVASAAHAARTGGGVLLWLDAAKHPRRGLVALLEDVAVVWLIVILLDSPVAAVLAVLVVSLVTNRVIGSQISAFAFAVRLVWARAWRTLGQPRWDDPESFPRWVREALAGDVMAPGGGLRGCPSGGHRLPGAPHFVTGWVVIRGDTPLFVFRGRGGAGRVDLGTLMATGVAESAFFRRVELMGRVPANLYVGLDGPGTESLKAEFLPV